MAKKYVDTLSQYRKLSAEIDRNSFSPVYLLMGEETYFIDRLVERIIANALQDDQRDFNQSIVYGADVTGGDVSDLARQYPMFAERKLVVVKDAQSMRQIEDLQYYLKSPVATTVLVIVFSGALLDKRKSIYRKFEESAVVFESAPVKDSELPQWIGEYVSAIGMNISAEASILLGEHCGSDISKIAMELDKLAGLLGHGGSIDERCIEENVGITRELSVFELTKALSYRDVDKVHKIAYYLGRNIRKTPAPMIIGALAVHFIKVLKVSVALAEGPKSDSDLAKIAGTYAGFVSEYRMAARNYPPAKAMRCISILKDFDYKVKGNARGNATDEELVMELACALLR